MPFGIEINTGGNGLAGKNRQNMKPEKESIER